MTEAIAPERRAELVRWVELNWGYYDTSRGLIAGAMTRMRPIPDQHEQDLLMREWAKRREEQQKTEAAAPMGASDAAAEGAASGSDAAPSPPPNVDTVTGEIVDEDIPFEIDEHDAAVVGSVSSAALAQYEPQQAVTSLGLFNTADPVEVITSAKRVADALDAVVEDRELYTVIGEKRHIEIEAWTLLGTMVGVYAVVVWTKQLKNGWEARAEARTSDGRVVGSAESECRMSESRWRSKPSNDLRSMAQTRAMRRALAMPLGFLVQLAGYEPTPSDDSPVTPAMHRKLHAVLNEFGPDSLPDGYSDWDTYSHDRAVARFGVQSRTELTVGEMRELIDEMQELAGGT